VDIRSKPAVDQDIAELNGICQAGGDHRTHQFILGELRRPLGLAGVDVTKLMGLGCKFEGDRGKKHRHCGTARSRVDAFDGVTFAVV